MSDAVHECVIETNRNARKLRQLLLSPDGSHLKPRLLALESRDEGLNKVAVELVAMCGRELRTLLWDRPNERWNTRVRSDLIQAWASCHSLTKFSLVREICLMSDEEVERQACNVETT